MKKLNNIFLLALVLLVGVASCELPDNLDPKHATEVPAATLFSQALYEMVDQTATTDYNANIGFLLAQHIGEVTYTNESRYDFQDRGIPDSYWNNYYRHVLMDFKEARLVIEGTTPVTPAETIEFQNQLYIIDICEVFVYHNLVDAFGNVPYSEALMGAENSSPKYDDAATIYNDLLARLTTSIGGLNASEGSFGSADMLYGGDVATWTKFAASIKLRLAMRLADSDPSASRIAAEAAVSNVFTSDAESAIFHYAGVAPYVNQIYNSFILGGRTDLVPTELFINTLKGYNDPRLALLTSLVDTNTVATDPPDMVYWGMPYGKENSSSYGGFSHFAPMFFDPTFEANLIDYSEVEFLLAEAVERGYAVGGTAAAHYASAVEANILHWGGSAADAATYLAQPEIDYATAVAATSWKETIGTQKWIALYNKGNEAFAEWRRLDFPVLIPPPGMTQADIPNRYPFPYNEEPLNGTNYDAASSAIGGDFASTKLFWDVN